jgi:hypothetical protein
MWHQDNVCPFERRDAGDFRKLIVVADDAGNFALADIKHVDVASAFVEEILVTRGVEFSLTSNISAGTNEDLRVEDDVVFFFT